MDAAREETPPATPFRFGTRSLLWATALLCTGMGVFGPLLGIYLASLVVLLHLVVVSWRVSRALSFRILAYALLLHLLVAMLLPAVSRAGPAAYRNQSMNKLKCLMLGILNFEGHNRCLPTPFLADGDGSKTHSWRTLILPYLEEQGLYDAIDLNTPWDSPGNQRVLDGVGVWCFLSQRLPARGGANDETHYFAVVDDETVWAPDGSLRLSDVTDDHAETIALIEVAGRGVAWAEPRDLSMEEAVDLLVGDDQVGESWTSPGFWTSTRHKGDGLHPRLVAFLDGHVRAIGYIPDRETAMALLTRSGGEDLTDWDKDLSYTPRTGGPGYIVHWARVLGLTLFIALAVAPLLTRRAGENVATEAGAAT